MMKRLLILLFAVLVQRSFSQQVTPRGFPRVAFTAQYAGSTGLYTMGISKLVGHGLLELGALYGRLPKAYGGVNHSLVLKVTLNPFQLDVTDKLILEPIQTGIFINQNFSNNLEFRWGGNYPKGYYWWPRSTRVHYFLGSQVSRRLNGMFHKISVYCEANTNDLYIYSYLSNTKALSLYDIFFLGAGLKLYL